eukprot:TRINITY_DN42492_c0_g1_i1.p1 TRINITY_DN42492_c0_g1~~TRINITY_DN42492_c0_g1_i1.p1  ORF type:complete len:223 (-),score=54.68 TRINITY_DN42492_c0_g1_i1:20-688(-)
MKGDGYVSVEAAASEENVGVDSVPEKVPEESLYLNIFLLNKDEVVKKGVQTKLQSKTPFKKWAFPCLTGLAAKVVKDEQVAGKIGQQLAAMLPSKLAELGIQGLESKVVFQRGSMVVTRLNLDKIDINTHALLTNAKGEEFAADFETLTNTLKKLEITDALASIDAKIRARVALALRDKLGEKLPEKLGSEGVKVDLVVLPSELQAAFFFDALEKLEDEVTR